MNRRLALIDRIAYEIHDHRRRVTHHDVSASGCVSCHEQAMFVVDELAPILIAETVEVLA